MKSLCTIREPEVDRSHLLGDKVDILPSWSSFASCVGRESKCLNGR